MTRQNSLNLFYGLWTLALIRVQALENKIVEPF